MKKRAILEQVAELRAVLAATGARLGEVESKLGWLHERVDMLAIRLENMRGNVTLDDAAAKRLTYQVGQFSARLDRLDSSLKAPAKLPRKRPRKPARPNHGAG